MSRVLKFRQWIIEKQLMTAPFILDHEFDCVTESFGPDLITMQFTGLLDKNGKEIYEDDLIKVLDRDWPSQLGSFPELNHEQYIDKISAVCRVVYSGGAFHLNAIKGGYFQDSLSKDYGRDRFEIIGNIHQNQELL